MTQTSQPVSYDTALSFLNSRIDYERVSTIPYRSRNFKLDRMRKLLTSLENPERQLNIIHVAGTKGKGSTATMIASVLTTAGIRTGLFTSPHLYCLEERFKVDGVPCEPADLVRLVARLYPVVIQMDREAAELGNELAPGPTYFEITTALALLDFSERAVDYAVLEVGLGGRLDSTNVCTPVVSVITSVSYDHTAQLGTTLREIAGEKAGIIKSGVPVVSGVIGDEPRSVIEQVCRDRGAPLFQLGADFAFDYSETTERDGHIAPPGQITYRERARTCYHERVPLGLRGHHQAMNAAVAVATLRQLGDTARRITVEHLRHGLLRVVCPARVEVFAGRSTVMIDAAHNVASIDALVRTLSDQFSPQQRWLVFATSRDKDAAGMLQQLLPWFDTVIFTQYRNNPRGVDPSELAEAARRLVERDRDAGQPEKQLMTRPDSASAWQTAEALATSDGLICVTGSFFVAAEIRECAGFSQSDPLHKRVTYSSDCAGSVDSVLAERSDTAAP